MPISSLIFSFLILLSSLARGEEAVNGAVNSDAVTAPGAYTVDSLLHNGPQCTANRANPSDPMTANIFASTYGPTKTEMQGKALAFFLSQTNFMRSHGLLQGEAVRSNNSDFQAMKNDCQGSQNPHRVATSMFDKAKSKLDSQTSPSPLTAAGVEMQKRYLAATIEYNRLNLVISNEPINNEELIKLSTRMQKIRELYPLAASPMMNSHALLNFSRQQSNPLQSRQTHEKIDDYLFPDPATKKFKTIPRSVTHSQHAAAQFMDQLITQPKIPDDLAKELSAAMTSGMKPIMQAIGALCKADPCQTLKINPSLAITMVNQIPEPGRTKTLGALCICDFGKKAELLPGVSGDILNMGVGGIAVAGLGAAGACILTNVGCGAAIVLGLVSSGFGGANTINNMRNLNEANNLRTIASALPTTTPEDLARLQAYEQQAYVDLGIDAALGLAGVGVTHAGSTLANSLANNPAVRSATQKLKDLFKRTDTPVTLPRGELTTAMADPNMRVTMSVDNMGRRTAVLNGNGVSTHLAIDSTGYAINAQDQVGRQLLDAHIASTNGNALLVVDVNNLGVTNYFRGGYEAGNTYLSDVAKKITEVVNRNGGGAVYRPGGDEFAIVLSTTDRARTKAIAEEINRVILDSSPNNVFAQELTRRQEIFDQVSTAPNVFQLPPSFFASRTDAELRYIADHGLEQFQKVYIVQERKNLAELATMRPSVSIGSVMINNRTPQAAYALADRQAAQVKNTYKTTLTGTPPAKYGQSVYLPAGYGTANPNAVPIILDPIN